MSRWKPPASDLLDAAKHGDYEYLIEELKVLEDPMSVVDKDKNNVLHMAVISPSVKCVKEILKFDGINATAKNMYDETPLTFAINNYSSLEIISALVEFNPSLINLKHIYHGYIIHHIIKHDHKNGMEIIKLFNETAKKFNIELEDVDNEKNMNCIFLSISHRKFDILEYLLLNTNFNPKHIYNDRNALETLIGTRCTNGLLTDNILDLLYEKIYGDIENFTYEIFEKLFKAMMPNRYGLYLWFLNRFYYHKFNRFVFLLNEIDKSNISERINNVDIIKMFCHSFVQDNFGKILHNNRQVDQALIRFNMSLYDIFLVDRNVFNFIIKHIHNERIKSNKHQYVIDFLDRFFDLLYENDEHSIDDATEFMDKILIQNFNVNRYFNRTGFMDRNFFKTQSLLPFIAINCADDILNNMLTVSPLGTRREILKSTISKYCSQKYQKGLISLSTMCRIVIRKTIFQTDIELENYKKLNKVKSLKLPNEILNYLMYNHTRYNMFAKN